MSAHIHVAHLAHRAVLEVSGADRVSYLQGLVSNDISLVTSGHALWSALLTPQGKYLADFFVLSHDQDQKLLLDVQADQADDLIRRLIRFRLRAQVLVQPSPLQIHAAWGKLPDPMPPQAIIAPDPRLPQAGWRVLSSTVLAGSDQPACVMAYDLHRLALGLPDGTRDIEPERSVLLEAGFDELHGVSWTKGCYMGQELTARTKYRGLLKRRLVPVLVHGLCPAPGTPILREGQEVGTMRSSCALPSDSPTDAENASGRGLAVLRLDSLTAPQLVCGDAHLTPQVPGWMVLPG